MLSVVRLPNPSMIFTKRIEVFRLLSRFTVLCVSIARLPGLSRINDQKFPVDLISTFSLLVLVLAVNYQNRHFSRALQKIF